MLATRYTISLILPLSLRYGASNIPFGLLIISVFVLTYRLHVPSSLPALLPDRRQGGHRIRGESPRQHSTHVVRGSHIGRPSVWISLGRWRQRVRGILLLLLLVSGRLRTAIIRHLYKLGVSVGRSLHGQEISMQRSSIAKRNDRVSVPSKRVSSQCVGPVVGNKIGTRNVDRYAGRTDIRSCLLRSGREVKEVCSARDSECM